ncbi:MAG: TraR/DksA family transcriptional regulator [Thermodesulfobacteriota bacterium]
MSEWMSRQEIADYLGIVVNSVRGKVQKGQIERRVMDGKHVYRVAEDESGEIVEMPAVEVDPMPLAPAPRDPSKPKPAFNPKQALLDQLTSVKVGRSIDAIEKGDEIDLATGEISRELDAKISMRQHRQIKEIEEALERLKLGEYGTCEECGDPIPEQRLRLYPAARYCVRCQEEVDHYERIRQAQGLREGGLREDATESAFAGSFDE